MKIDNNSIENVCLAKLSPKMQDMLRKIEASFTAEMLSPIFENTVETSSNKIYQSMMVGEYSKLVGPKTGIADTLACSMLQLQDND